MRYRLALDMGTNSIGWAVLRLHDGKPVELNRLGVRIFPDGRNPQSQDSLAENRRQPRSQRRRRDRYVLRRNDLLAALRLYGLMPDDDKAAKALQKENPYRLRTQGLTEALTPFQLGRAIFHLNQRRGFKSNRKTDRGAKDSGKIRQAIKAFADTLGEHSTVGELLYQRQQQGEGTRARLYGDGAKAQYAFYVSREMIEQEFDALWQAQTPHHPELLNEEAYQTIHGILFRQRKLKLPPVGRCTLIPELPRAPKALPSSQNFRLYQEINNLQLIDLETGEETALGIEQRDQLVDYLKRRKSAKYLDLRKQLFGKQGAAQYQFSIEVSALGRSELPGNTSNYALKHKKGFGKRWLELPDDEQEAIVERLLETENEAELIEWLMQSYAVNAEQAEYIANAPLEPGHFQLSREAIHKILPHLLSEQHDEQGQAKPSTYDQAVRAADFPDHRVLPPGKQYPELPSYPELLQRYCQEMPNTQDPDNPELRITNPTVHIGLNQLRRLVNALIRKYGRPDEIHLELARELKVGRERKRDIETENRNNRERNKKLNEELRNTYNRPHPTAEDRLRLRLLKELDTLNPRCVYSDGKIEPSKLLTNKYQIDHILPFSKTLDDSYNNKVLVTSQANKDKGNRSVWELAQLKGYDWEAIEERAAYFDYNKRKRFTQNALEDWSTNSGQFVNDGAGFLQRQLTDTAYLARVSREYLQVVCPPNKIVCSPGKLTAMLRAKWGLNTLLNHYNGKNRNDHRHHAIDAALIGIIDRSTLQKVATRAAQAKEDDQTSLLKGINDDLPWPEFYKDLEKRLKSCIISHKPNHKPQAQLHEETAMGLVEVVDEEKGIYLARKRMDLSALKEKHLTAPTGSHQSLQNPHLAEALRRATDGLSYSAFQKKLFELQQDDNWPKKAYVLLKINSGGVAVALKGTALSPDPKKRPERAAKLFVGGANYCYEIYAKDNGAWDGTLISRFTANQAAYRDFMQDKTRFKSSTFCGKPLLMRLIINDVVILEEEPGQKCITRVHKMTKGKITLCEHFEANVAERHSDSKDAFRFQDRSAGKLKALRARQAYVDVMGRIRDPGFSD